MNRHNPQPPPSALAAKQPAANRHTGPAAGLLVHSLGRKSSSSEWRSARSDEIALALQSWVNASCEG
jgi:hypothetical protein